MFDNSNSNVQLGTGTKPDYDALTKAIDESKGLSSTGNDSTQNTLSFCRGQEVDAARSTQSATKEVDSRVIVGSHGVGDHRVKASPAAMPANTGPREGMRQESLNSKLKANVRGTVQNWPGNLADSDSGN